MRLVFAGTPDVAVASLEALLDSAHEVVAVVTRPDAASGRGRRSTPSPVAEVARERGIEVLTPDRPDAPDFVTRLRDLRVDCAPVVAYGGLIPPLVLTIPGHGWVNLHFSLLPAWRGAAPVQRAIIAGDELTGATTFRLEAGLDTGPVYGVVTEPIGPLDTSGDVLQRLAQSGARLLVATLDGIASGDLAPRPQGDDGVSYAPKLTARDAEVDWTAPALSVDRLVRGCSPAPGAWTTFRGERLKLGPVQMRVDRPDLAGAAVALSDGEVLVGTGSHAVALGQVQAAGRRAMPADDWARGVRVEPGEQLGVDGASR